MERNLFLPYESPVVEVIEIEVEKGFANSSESYEVIEEEWD